MINIYKKYLDFALQTSKEAVNIALKARSTASISVRKGDLHNYATNADIEVEHYILDKIKNNFSNHAILSEESGEIETNSPYRWIIDPIDGTWAYKVGLPQWGTIIALEFKGEIVVSVINLPISNEIFTAYKNGGFFLNGKKIKCSSVNDIKASFIFINHPSFKTPPELFESKMKLIEKLTRTTYRTFPSHTTSVDLARVAQGVYEADIVTSTSGGWWDLCAGILMVKEAKGKVSTYDNKEVTSENYNKGFIASNGKIHQQLLEIVKDYV